MKFLAEAILVLPVNIVMAWWHSRLIKANRPVKHGLWGGLYVSLLAAAIWWQSDNLISGTELVAFVIAALCGRLVVFNISLNLFRDKSPFYTSNTTTSIIDKVELRLFGGRVWLVEALLFLLFMILQFFI